MPAGTTVFTKTLDAIVRIASANSGLAAPQPRVARGYTRYADTDNLENLIANLTAENQGYLSLWLKEITVAQNEVFPVRVIGELLVPVPKDVSTDLNTGWDFVVGLVNQLADPAQYLNGEIPPNRINVRLHKIDVTKKQGIAIWDFGNYGAGGIEFPDP